METGVYLKFREFTDKGAALDLIDLLSHHDIIGDMEVMTTNFDPGFSRSEINKEYYVKLKKEDFARAETVLRNLATMDLQKVQKNHYLFRFSDDELLDLLAKEDEWNEYDIVLAQQILTERGKPVSERRLREMKEDRMRELARPVESPKTFIRIAYVMAVLGGFVAIMMGWHLIQQKKTLPNGDRMYSYAPADRKQGERILWLGIFFLALYMILLFASSMGLFYPTQGYHYY